MKEVTARIVLNVKAKSPKYTSAENFRYELTQVIYDLLDNSDWNDDMLHIDPTGITVEITGGPHDSDI